MNKSLSERLNHLNIKRLSPGGSIANYLPCQRFENFIFISGQLPLVNKNLLHSGKINSELNEKEALDSIKLATSNLLWNLSDLVLSEKVSNIKCLNIKGYLNCTEDFHKHADLLNISSDMIVEVLGKNNGLHSRSAIGVNSLPKNSPVEIDGIFGLLS